MCRSTPARHVANPYQPERHHDAQEKLKHYILLNWTLTINIMYFNCCAYIRIRIQYVSLTMHIYMGTYLYGTKLIRTRTEPLRNKRVFMDYY